jgi:hypothetical protein
VRWGREGGKVVNRFIKLIACDKLSERRRKKLSREMLKREV